MIRMSDLICHLHDQETNDQKLARWVTKTRKKEVLRDRLMMQVSKRDKGDSSTRRGGIYMTICFRSAKRMYIAKWPIREDLAN